jgi:polar amino acid transport system permease protein
VTYDTGLRPGDAELKVTGRRHPGRWAAAAVVLVIVAMIVHALATDANFRWAVVGRYFFDHLILRGLLMTVELTAIAMVIATVLGTVLALMRLSGNPVLSVSSGAYIWFFRGTPLLVQLIFFYNISALYPKLSIGIPFGPAVVQGNVNQLVTPFLAAVLSLSLNEAAYMAEIIRGGIVSVEHGQSEAAQALGMSSWLVLRRIVLPQAMRLIIPPASNQVISMLKITSLVSVISLADLLYSAQMIYSNNFETIPLLIVASLWYLIVVSVLTGGQVYLERRLGRGNTRLIREKRWRRTVNALHSLAGRSPSGSEEVA